MGNIKKFFIADTHFGHKNIINYEKRPFQNIREMDEFMINKWNEVVSSNDIVYHLGDVSFYNKEKTKEIISKLNGKKVLIKGNHDDRSNEWFREVGFDEVSEYPIVLDEWVILQHEPPTYINDFMPYYYLYGHVHGTEMYQSVTKSSACVCVERWGYAPVDIDEIKRIVNETTD